MDEQIKTPLDLMAELLAKMTARAMEAERQRDEAEKRGAEWYEGWKRKDARLQEVECTLAAEITEHSKTRKALKEMLERLEKEDINRG